MTIMCMTKESTKFIRSSIPTPLSLRHFKIGFTDELAPVVSVCVALFFACDHVDNNQMFVSHLEKSLEKTLTRFYPLSGRYVEQVRSIDCNDQGAEFIHAQVNIKLQDVLDHKVNVKLFNDFIPYKFGLVDKVTDPILSAQVTMFECGGVALGVNITHRIADASTLRTFLMEWASESRGNNEVEFSGPGFISTSLFPGRGLTPLKLAETTNELLTEYVTLNFSFNENMISMLEEKAALAGRGNATKWSKVQLVSGFILKGFIGVDTAIHNYRRDAILVQPINLREKFASLIPKDSCGNLWGIIATEFGNAETTEELADILRDSIKKAIHNYSEVHLHENDEELQTLVMNSFLYLDNLPPMANVMWVTSWCKFPFYDVDFGFGKPIWASVGTVPLKNTILLMDDVGGNGVEAYVSLEVKHVPHFHKAQDYNNAFAT